MPPQYTIIFTGINRAVARGKIVFQKRPVGREEINMIAPGLDFQPRKKILKVETSTDGTGSSTVDNIVMHGRDEADETGWIPIDTAPKDGSDIILANDDEIKTAHWDDVSMGDKKGWQVACEPGNFWNYYTEIKNPTHWMPLPAKPKRKYPPVKRGRGLK